MAKQGELSAKQGRFCLEYVVDMNGTQAAIRAGYSPKTARQIAAKLLSKVNIQEKISSLAASAHLRNEVSVDLILSEMKAIAHVDIGDLFDEKGALLSVKAMPERVRRAICGFDKNGFPKFHSKNAALDMLARHKELFKGNSDSDSNMPQRIQITVVDPREGGVNN